MVWVRGCGRGANHHCYHASMFDYLVCEELEKDLMSREILGSTWFTDKNGTIGVVAVITSTHDPEKREWKAHISIARGWDKQNDERLIAEWGSALSQDVAHVFFPYLDITKYKQS